MGCVICRVCRVPKGEDEYYRRKGGAIRPICRSCQAEKSSRYYEQNRYRILSGEKIKYWGEPGIREKKLEGMAGYREQNRISLVQKAVEYQRQHPKEAKERRNRWEESHPSWRKEYQKRPERKLYRRLWEHNRRAQLGSKMSANVFYYVISRDESKCQYCRKPLAEEEITLDHIIPVSRGGTNDSDNLCVACRSCNGKKKDRLTAPPGTQTNTEIEVKPRMQTFDIKGESWILIPLNVWEKMQKCTNKPPCP